MNYISTFKNSNNEKKKTIFFKNVDVIKDKNYIRLYTRIYRKKMKIKQTG